MANILTAIENLPLEQKAELMYKLLGSVFGPAPPSLASQGTSEITSIKMSTAAKPLKLNMPASHYDYPDSFKKEVADKAFELNNNRGAADFIIQKYAKEGKYQSLTEKTVREWRWDKRYNSHYEEDLAKKNRPQKRVVKGKYHHVEIQLIEKIKQKRAQGLAVTRNWIKAEAISSVEDPSFGASEGWFARFAERWKLSLRVATKVIQTLSNDYVGQIIDFMDSIGQKRMEFEVRKKLKLVFGNVDQVPFQFDMGNGTTYDFEGTREIKLVRTTGVKQRFTVQLTALENGIFLPPVFIFKSRSKKVPEKLVEKYKDKALIYANSTGWVTEQIMLDYLEKIWLNLNINSEKEKLYLVADKFSVHKMASVQEKLEKGGSLYQLIPAGCTGLVQPLDTCLNKPIKDHVRETFGLWFDNEGSKTTNTTKIKQYVKPPSIETVIDWVLTACDKISPSLITKSFKHCAISQDLLGADNHLINKKLLSKDEIHNYLNESFYTKTSSPYSDRTEIDSQIAAANEGVTYDIETRPIESRTSLNTLLVPSETVKTNEPNLSFPNQNPDLLQGGSDNANQIKELIPAQPTEQESVMERFELYKKLFDDEEEHKAEDDYDPFEEDGQENKDLPKELPSHQIPRLDHISQEIEPENLFKVPLSKKRKAEELGPSPPPQTKKLKKTEPPPNQPSVSLFFPKK